MRAAFKKYLKRPQKYTGGSAVGFPVEKRLTGIIEAASRHVLRTCAEKPAPIRVRMQAVTTTQMGEIAMPGLLAEVDPDGLLEYSVVYTDRAVNHMSGTFQKVMTDISAVLKDVFSADAAIIVPGSGTFGMEAVARQLAGGRRCLIVRNGFFSYRWSQILDMGNIAADTTVMMARRTGDSPQAPFAPAPIDEVVQKIRADKPGLVFAPHVETSSGMLLPDDYLKAIADAVHEVGGLFVLDCIASGTIWVDMRTTGVDVLISAPQKGWSGSPCCAFVMLNDRALAAVAKSTSSSFACDLRKWHEIMQAYESGAHAYHATMPTDALKTCRDVMLEAKHYGFALLCDAQQELGDRVRALLAARGFRSVAAPGFEAPGVVVCYTDDPDIKSGRKFAAEGLQIAAGVPLQCNESADFQSFRLGLFGLDKLQNIERTVASLDEALDGVLEGTTIAT
jgi:aspartate aminotransferase-like enzyme